MLAADRFGKRCEALIDWHYDCVDRIVLNGRYNLACSPGGFRTWWRDLFGDDSNLNDKSIGQMAWECARHIRMYCAAQAIPVIDCGQGMRKDEIAAEHVHKAEATGRRGLFVVLSGKAPAPVWAVDINKKSGKIVNLRYKKPWPYVKHYSFHIMDEQWGHIIIKMCGYPPFGLQIILNGHNWVDRQLQRRGRSVRMDENCFIGGDHAAVQRWANQLSGPRGGREIEAVCERWAYSCALDFALPMAARQRTGFAYWWSVYQLEVSRNYHFRIPAALDEVYQSLIDVNRRKLDVKRLKTIFGLRSRPRIRTNRNASTRGERGRREAVSCSVDALEYDLTVFKVHWANRTLKLYDKGRGTLRGEAVIHNARDLKTKRGLDNWDSVVKLMSESLLRFFDALDTLDVGLVDAGRLDQWGQPEQIGKCRLAGIAIENVRMRALLNSLTELSVFNHKVTRTELTAATHRKMKTCGGYTPRQASYDIKKLKAKGLLVSKRCGKKYQIDLMRLRELIGVITVRDHILKKVCAIGAHYQPTGKPSTISFSESSESLTQCVSNIFAALHLEAA
jgi:DNA-binding transcriptional ArsR family regulator